MTGEVFSLSSLITRHSSLIVNPHLVERARRVAPALFDLDEEFEVDLVAEQVLDVLPRLRAYLLYARAALAYHDSLLRLALDVDGAVDSRQLFGDLLVALRDDSRHVRNLLARHLQNLLANHLGDDDPHRLVGQLVLFENRLALREIRDELLNQIFQLVARARGERHDRAPLVLARVELYQREQPALVVYLVRLVQEQHRGLARLLHEV